MPRAALLCVLLALAAHAQKADSPADPTLVVTASVASLDKLAAVAKEMGIGDVPMLTAEFIEQQMPFIGAGGLASDRPLGVLLYAGPKVDLEKAATFVLPVNAGKAELKNFIDKGAQPVAGRTDLVTLEGVGFRRAREHFIFGQIIDAVSAVRDDVLTLAYANDPATLASVDVDIAAFKRSMPERYDAFLAELDDDVDKNDPAQRAGADLVISLIRELSRVGVSLSRSEAGGLRLSVNAAPFAAAKAPQTKFTRPGFPEGTVFRADLAHPPAQAFARVTDAVAALVERDENLQKLTPQQQRQVKSLASDVANFLLAGDAGSLGAEVVKEHVVVYWVTRQAPGGAKRDLAQEISALAANAAEIAKLTKQARPFLSFEQYADDDGTRVSRLVLLEDAKPALYLDALQRVDAVLMSITAAEGKFVERLLALKDEGESAALASGWVDVSALAGSSVLPPGEDPKAIEEFKTAMKGHRLEWTASPDAAGDALQIDVNLPKGLVQNLSKLVKLFQ